MTWMQLTISFINYFLLEKDFAYKFIRGNGKGEEGEGNDFSFLAICFVCLKKWEGIGFFSKYTMVG